jgi:hypothetical protein
MQIRSVGIDLGKTTVHLVALGAAGKVLLRKTDGGPYILGSYGTEFRSWVNVSVRRCLNLEC